MPRLYGFAVLAVPMVVQLTDPPHSTHSCTTAEPPSLPVLLSSCARAARDAADDRDRTCPDSGRPSRAGSHRGVLPPRARSLGVFTGNTTGSDRNWYSSKWERGWEERRAVVPKHVLKTLDLTTLLVALDHLEEYGPSATVADPYVSPSECVYIVYIGETQAAALATRLPHLEVVFRLPGVAKQGRVVRKVFSKSAVTHVMQFAFPTSPGYAPFVRELASVKQKYWRVLNAAGAPIQPPRGKSKN